MTSHNSKNYTLLYNVSCKMVGTAYTNMRACAHTHALHASDGNDVIYDTGEQPEVRQPCVKGITSLDTLSNLH